MFDARGWPMRSLEARNDETNAKYQWYWGFTLTRAASQFGAVHLGDMKVLPLKPIWPGFAINTIFYAAIVWFLSFAPGAIRRRIGGVRRKRGQCASCGYSLRDITSEKCPECGAIA